MAEIEGLASVAAQFRERAGLPEPEDVPAKKAPAKKAAAKKPAQDVPADE
jgi:hypothetical protein